VVGEVEQLALGLEILVQEVHLGAGGETLQLVLQGAEVHRQGLGVHRGLAGDAGAEQPLRLTHLVEVGEERPDQGDDAQQREADQHRAAPPRSRWEGSGGPQASDVPPRPSLD
jgi:hypothetical protein